MPQHEIVFRDTFQTEVLFPQQQEWSTMKGLVIQSTLASIRFTKPTLRHKHADKQPFWIITVLKIILLMVCAEGPKALQQLYNKNLQAKGPNDTSKSHEQIRRILRHFTNRNATTWQICCSREWICEMKSGLKQNLQRQAVSFCCKSFMSPCTI